MWNPFQTKILSLNVIHPSLAFAVQRNKEPVGLLSLNPIARSSPKRSASTRWKAPSVRPQRGFIWAGQPITWVPDLFENATFWAPRRFANACSTGLPGDMQQHKDTWGRLQRDIPRWVNMRHNHKVRSKSKIIMKRRQYILASSKPSFSTTISLVYTSTSEKLDNGPKLKHSSWR